MEREPLGSGEEITFRDCVLGGEDGLLEPVAAGDRFDWVLENGVEDVTV